MKYPFRRLVAESPSHRFSQFRGLIRSMFVAAALCTQILSPHLAVGYDSTEYAPGGSEQAYCIHTHLTSDVDYSAHNTHAYAELSFCNHPTNMYISITLRDAADGRLISSDWSQPRCSVVTTCYISAQGLGLPAGTYQFLVNGYWCPTDPGWGCYIWSDEGTTVIFTGPTSPAP